MPPRRGTRGRGGNARGGSARGGKPKSATDAIAERVMRSAASAGSKSGTQQQQLKGPTDAERQFPKLTDEQVSQFLADDGTFAFADRQPNNSDQQEEATTEELIVENGADIDDDLNGEMPEPAPMDDVFGAASAAGGAAGGNGLLGRLLDPDAGGVGQNRDGMAGLVAPPKPSGNNRQRLRAKMKALKEQRTALNEESTVRDAKGRKMPGRMLSPEALQAGIKMPKNSQIDQTLTGQKRKELLESMKAKMAQDREQKLAGVSAAPTAISSSIVDDDSADIGI